MRTPVIIGNWKMNLAPSEAKALLRELRELDLDQSVEKGVCVPAIDLLIAEDILKDSDIKFGAQNMYFEESGAYTGEISPTMLNDIKADYVILGHSERREYFKEDDELINKKVLSALEHDIIPILCVGETLEERESNKEEEKVRNQLEKDLKDVKDSDIEKVIIAYEPIWAIGTGKTASSDDADCMCKFIRDYIKKVYGEDYSEKIRIQYGGSMKPKNVKELLAKENIDGGLIGGASLKASDFEQLINYKK
ncbi:triose-phosphate isomerase [Anaerococcus porci]|uniref:Triosephosphate isomerase n=1 Tax=Anaerococcus porci TaxID=2652269 RepID=A0A6N7VTE3_9FIRM|nr:triose-phosphate isomerase [Anaerococcus porci]MDY3007369.1 triose-phosphate isomerase [Anaerococcus porci]MSS76979.1 triose-phosphate isomerase [Anaerococcus porci]